MSNTLKIKTEYKPLQNFLTEVPERKTLVYLLPLWTLPTSFAAFWVSLLWVALSYATTCVLLVGYLEIQKVTHTAKQWIKLEASYQITLREETKQNSTTNNKENLVLQIYSPQWSITCCQHITVQCKVPGHSKPKLPGESCKIEPHSHVSSLANLYLFILVICHYLWTLYTKTQVKTFWNSIMEIYIYIKYYI